MKVLVVDNNQLILDQLCDLLESDGYTTIKATSGEEALKVYREQNPDFICLDIMMEGISGHDVCRTIRNENKTIPIVFVTSKSSTVEKVVGLDIGADDYITKPFDLFEVRARIRAIARRCLVNTTPPQKMEDSFTLSNVKIFPAKLRADIMGNPIDLSPRDVKILKIFYENKGKVVHRDFLLDKCWGVHIMPESRTVDWHISQLRKKIELDPENPKIIKTIHGAGYKFEE